MKHKWLPYLFVGALSFAAGCALTNWSAPSQAVHAQNNRAFELRVYHAVPGRLPALLQRFREDVLPAFDRHNMKSLGYWVPQDGPGKDKTLIYVLAHPSRDAATKNWQAFREDPEWVKARKASEARDGEIVEKVDSTFMDPTDFSAVK